MNERTKFTTRTRQAGKPDLRLLFQLSNLIPKFAGTFVIFFIDCRLHIAAQLEQLVLQIRRSSRSRRSFPLMSFRTMDVHQERLEVGLKMDVVIAAPKPTALAELCKRNSTRRASLLVRFRQLLDGFVQLKLLC